jgi:hypothetical protein
VREQKPVICPTAQAHFSANAGRIHPIGLKRFTKLVFWRDGFGGIFELWKQARPGKSDGRAVRAGKSYRNFPAIKFHNRARRLL